MEKQKRWQLFLILSVIVLTIYNIIPTLFFYSQPLKQPIQESKGNEVALDISERTNSLAQESLDWLKSFCKNLHVKPSSIALDQENSELIQVAFTTTDDANKFRAYLPRAGSLIPFAPAQLSLYSRTSNDVSKTVFVQRKIPILLDTNQVQKFFTFSPKTELNNTTTDLYKTIILDRAFQLSIQIGGTSENADYVSAIINNPGSAQTRDLLLYLSRNIVSSAKGFGETSAIAQRYFSSYSQISLSNKSDFIRKFVSSLELVKDGIKLERIDLEQEEQRLQTNNNFLDTIQKQKLDLLISQEKTLDSAAKIIKNNSSVFASGKTPWTYDSLQGIITTSALNTKSNVQTISFEDRDPFIKSLQIDWDTEKFYLELHEDFLTLKNELEQKPSLSSRKNIVEQLLFDDIAFLSRESSETITPRHDRFEITLSDIANSKSFLAMNLASVAKTQVEKLKYVLFNSWNPKHPDLKKENFPVWDFDTFQKLSFEDQKLGLLLYSPVQYQKLPPKGFKTNSIYVIAKGVQDILEKARSTPDSDETKQFFSDFNELRALLEQNGFYGYPGSVLGPNTAFTSDYIFEDYDYFQTILKATRENFSVHGTKRFAVLEFSNLEQRILTENKIDTLEHEDLLKWRDDYHAAKLGIKGVSPYDVPPPTKNAFFNNLKISTIKYFRGDDRKILTWGLDLSGGKTVQIELRDNNNRLVTQDADIQQGINELYKRVNKLGVSEVSIRREGNFITLDFPGAQGFSASELVKASSMYFHVVNEKFSTNNPLASEYVNRFLQEIWNEAVVTNRTEPEDVNLIAWRHLYGSSLDQEVIQPRSEAAEYLLQNELKLSNPLDSTASSFFDDSRSKIAIMKGDSFTDWAGQSHPLLVVFNNYALEGSNLQNVQSSFDPSKGNFLSFEIKSSSTVSDGQKINPRSDIYAWTSQFSKEKIAGTSNESYSQGKGWRMAVILNGLVISSPMLDEPIRNSASITGGFSQREINQLEADLKAGSLTFTPKILSEKNVSPEIGSKERMHAIIATFLALVLVGFAMIGYYRFAGMVASIAVVFNLLIMWATLQNLGATITLANIAGIILTVGMAVDANVLVFERIREEFTVTGRIASAVHAGYRKAFSAIFDSNITTIIAALILLQFDSGPIKGFAVTLIVGILSSMFTALFMTRYFFTGWVKNPENKTLSMSKFISPKKFNFLKFTRPAYIISIAVVALGLLLANVQRGSLLGMDFTGGFAINLELQPSREADYRTQVEKALLGQGANSQDFQIRELTPSNNIRLFLSRNMEALGKPLSNLVENPNADELGYAYESNPKIVWVVDTLQKAGVSLTPQSLERLDKNWSEISGQMSSSMRNSAIIGLLLAIICIMIYITIRFEFKYAISATICIAHDVIFTIACISILHMIGVPVQLDLHTIAALLTIIGYSLNDTIIVFDRIREDLKHMRKHTFYEVINHALNTTLSRTLLTSGTTLLVLLPLIVLGGSTIFGFSLVMAIGVIFGTLSSLFVAAPLLQYFHNREQEKQEKLVIMQ